MNKADQYYKDNLIRIRDCGSYDNSPRATYVDGTPAYSKFITNVYEEYDLSKDEFPIPTLRNTAIKKGINEILWIYQLASNNLNTANSLGINWWDSWDIGNDTIGNRYGFTVDQYSLMRNLLDGLRNDPFGRRHIMDLYQYEHLNSSIGLFPCAFLSMWSVRKESDAWYLDMSMIQRSNDYIIAGYINKIQYVALQMMVAKSLGYEVGKFSHYVQNLHIYSRHFNAMNELLGRTPLDIQPKLQLPVQKDFYEYNVLDFKLIDCLNIPKIDSPLELAI